jgi:leader peptidase (prepilin peptidase) / N-methyltransferase
MSAIQAPTTAPANVRDRGWIPVAALALPLAGLAASGQTVGPDAAVAAFAAAVVVVLAAIDMRRRIIPNRIVLPATAIVLLARVAFFSSHALEFFVASALAALSLLILNLITRSGIGMGDVKFALLIGATLGPGAVGAIAIGFFAIFPVALAVLIRNGLSARKTWLPLGPFLALGTLVVLIAPGVVG